MLAIKRLADVAPEVDLRECTLHSPLQKTNEAEPTLALKPRGYQKSKTGVQVALNSARVYVHQKYLRMNGIVNQEYIENVLLHRELFHR